MDVVGEPDVLAAYRSGRRRLLVPTGALVTPLAEDVAHRLGVRLQEGAPDPRPVLGSDPGVALRRTLYRRHPGYVSGLRKPELRAPRLGRVGILGVGGAGGRLAHLAALGGAAEELVLVDIVPKLAESVALDLEYASAAIQTSVRVRAGDDATALAGCDVVVVAPDRPWPSSVVEDSAESLVCGEVRRAADLIAEHAPTALVILVTHPSEVLATDLLRSLNAEPHRVLAVGATLASHLLRRALALVAGVPTGDVEAVALGAATDRQVPVVSTATVRGRPARDAMPGRELDAALAAFREAVEGTSTTGGLRIPAIAPAHAALEVLQAVRGARPGPVPVSAYLEGAYGVDGVVLGVTAVLGGSGVQEVVELHLEPAEAQLLAGAADAVRSRSESLVDTLP